ncbi:MAG: hypothetical protein QNK35_10490 [Bacteroides sp.]|nr:hypothetical protein [Bacteroides sp.]
MSIKKLLSGPLGGDQQLGALAADFLIDSPHFSGRYNKIVKDYSKYINRNI